jgi:DNA replication protein DnaC
MNTSDYQSLLSEFRDSAHKMMFSNSTIDAFSSGSTVRQINAVMRMLSMELDTRAENKRCRLLRQAAFPAIKSIDDFDFSGIQFPEGYTKEDLSSLAFLDMAENLVLYGPSGRGKTHLAVALGILAANSGRSVRFYTAADLVYALSAAHRSNTLEKIYAQIERADILLIDEFGYIPFDGEGSRLLFQVISKCYETRSLVFTTNIEFSRWGTVLGDDKLAAAAIDRVVHHGRLITFTGPNRRMENALMMNGKQHDAAKMA